MSLDASSLFSVKGTVAVITGGGTVNASNKPGLGRTIALALDANHASKVFILGRRENILHKACSQATNGSLIAIPTDISSKESLEAAYKAIAAQTTHIDLLLVNSGIVGPPTALPPNPDRTAPPTLLEFRDHHFSHPMDSFSRVFDVNVTGSHYTILAFLPLLANANLSRPSPQQDIIAPPRPQIIITSSIGGLLDRPAGFAYGLSKAALRHMVGVWCSQLAEHQIRVNGIAPGLFFSDMTCPMYERFGIPGSGVSDGSFPAGHIPVTRGGGEVDVAGLVLWMASFGGGYLNGETVVLDGGRRRVIA
ncbi:NAD(P)-binding protein [Aspergillus steynii IBT 23096]|uniref:NAD(P)-binding protein n=1 Tax=Aspergillus steynii IBT 23096 TaxID=1392250 RepID=A0A2I2GFH9_9EURO|nr:NAD(P)-binding protein [Aspergillus steynii IBT 23096]PLB51638.1 NAD(P)-binding protein [Aspergillus steynii IBT 23096]